MTFGIISLGVRFSAVRGVALRARGLEGVCSAAGSPGRVELASAVSGAREEPRHKEALEVPEERCTGTSHSPLRVVAVALTLSMILVPEEGAAVAAFSSHRSRALLSGAVGSSQGMAETGPCPVSEHRAVAVAEASCSSTPLSLMMALSTPMAVTEVKVAALEPVAVAAAGES